MVWGSYAVKIEVKMGLLVLRRVLRLARMLCALMYRQNGDLANLLISARKKSAQSARLSAGGCNCYLGNAQIEVATHRKVLPLSIFAKQRGLGGIFVPNQTSDTLNLIYPT